MLISHECEQPQTTRQVFVVLRWDGFQQFDNPPDYVTGTKAFSAQSEAEAECALLNELKGHDGVRYFVRMARTR